MTIGLAGGAVHYGKLPLANLQTESRGGYVVASLFMKAVHSSRMYYVTQLQAPGLCSGLGAKNNILKELLEGCKLTRRSMAKSLPYVGLGDRDICRSSAAAASAAD